uniref:protein tweety homolog 1-like n=1 Tax=Myxine glutinosa TaxID=7769 RepID=UPI00358F6E89
MDSPLVFDPPTWSLWLRSVPRRDFELHPVSLDFAPHDAAYQQSLVLVAACILACLGLNVLFLLFGLVCLCRRESTVQDGEGWRARRSCLARTLSSATLLFGVAVGLGFHGNSEVNEGVARFGHSLGNVNITANAARLMVEEMRQGLKNSVRPALLRLQEVLAAEEGNAVEQWLVSASARTRHLEGCLVPLVDPMDCSSPPNLMTQARVVQSAETQRWLGYLVMLIAEFLLCLLCLLSFASRHGYLLLITMTSCSLFLLLSWLSLALNLALTVALGDVCRTPEQYMLYVSQHHCSASQGTFGELLDYFLFCPPTTANPFQKDLVLCLRLLSNTQNVMIHLPPIGLTAPKTEVFSIQVELNTTERQLQDLTALLSCRGLRKDYVQAIRSVCEGCGKGLLFQIISSVLSIITLNVLTWGGTHTWSWIISRNTVVSKKTCWPDEGSQDTPAPLQTSTQHLTEPLSDYAIPTPPCQESMPAFPRVAERVAEIEGSSGIPQWYLGASGDSASVRVGQETRCESFSTCDTDYMNQNILFADNPRYENFVMMGRSSPPPTYVPSKNPAYTDVDPEWS